jgi:hypothetical protein
MQTQYIHVVIISCSYNLTLNLFNSYNKVFFFQYELVNLFHKDDLQKFIYWIY